MAPKSKLTRSTPSALRSRSFIGAGSRASARRVWPILIIFLVIIALITGGVIALLRRNANTSLATTFTSQPLSDEAQASLQVSPLAPEDYLIGGNLDIAGALGVNTITSSADMLVGSQEHAVAIQGSNVSLSATIGGTTNTLRFATPSGTSKTIVVPNASGTIAVSASGPLILDANGNLSCPSCVSPATTASATSPIPTVTPNETASLNAISGDVLLQGTGNQIVITNTAGSKTITLSLPQDINTSASPVFANINITQSLQVADMITAGSLTLTAPLTVSSGGTGVSSLPTNSVVLGNGSDALTSITGNNGQCLVINGSLPTFGACPGADGVASINGQNGALTINASSPSSILTTGTTITIQDASATVKGLASFNAANLTVTSGVVDTIQDIAVTSTPTFAGLNLTSALALASGGTNATTSSGARINLGAAASGVNTDITSLSGLTSALSVLQGGTGATTYTDGQLLIGDSSNGGLKVAGLTAGAGVVIANGNGTINISAPTAGTCPGCASTSLSNLSNVAINTSLLPGTNNTIDTGSAAAAFRNGYYGTSLRTPSLDTITAGQLNVGASIATNILLGADTSLVAGKSLTVNGGALFKNDINSSSAFLVQNASSAVLMGVDTTISAANLITNPGFDVNDAGWSAKGSSVKVQITTQQYSGQGSEQIATTAVAGQGISWPSTMATSTQYTLSAYVRLNTGTATTITLGHQDVSGADVDCVTGTGIVITATGWTRLTCTFNTAGTVTSPNIYIKQTDAVARILYVDGFVLNTGAAAQPYSLGAIQLNGTITAPVSFQGTTNSTTAFQIQDAAGSKLLNADTSNGVLSVGTYFPTTIWSSPTNTKTDYTAGTQPSGIAAADFNSDGNADTAVTNQGSNTVSVFMNNGGGTLAAKVDYATGTAPDAVTSADFNSDGKPDLVVTNRSSNTISVFINNGNGTFATKVDYATGTTPLCVTSADFNGDGKPDFAVAYAGNTSKVSIFSNSGNGTFAAKVDYTTGFGDSGTYAITAADFNGDGKLDLATTQWDSGAISVLINSGTGTFPTHADINLGTYSGGQLFRTTSLITADFNGDGKPDLATGSGQNSNAIMAVFLNKGDGTGTFNRFDYPYVSGNNAQSMVSMDYNGDGYKDIILGNSQFAGSGYRVFINTGNGGFSLSATNYATTGSVFGLASADFNGNNTPDLAVANNSTNNTSIIIIGSATGSPVIQTSAKLTINTSGLTVGQLIQAAAGQSGDLLQARSDLNAILFSVGATGSVLVKNSVDSSTALQVQQASGASVLGVDTINGRVGIGNATPNNKLSINTLTTSDFSNSQVAIGTGGSSNKGLIIQGVAGQTADMLQVQSSTGAVMASVGATGSALFKNTTNSTTGFQIQNAAGSVALTVDTTAINAIVSNGNFEAGTTGWVATGTGASIAQNAAQQYSGSNSLALTTGTTVGGGARLTTGTALAVNTTYTLSFYAKADNAFNTLSASYSPTGTASVESDCAVFSPVSRLVLATDWTRYVCTINTSATASTAAGYIAIKQSDTTSRVVYIDAVQVEAGGPITQAVVANPSFEVNTTGWAYVGTPGSIAQSAVDFYNGTKSLLITTTANANNGAKYTTANTNPTQLAVNTSYTLSFWAKSTGTALTTLAASYARDGVTEVGCALSSTTLSTTDWGYYNCTFVTDGTAPAASAYISIENSAASVRTWYIDNAQLTANSSVAIPVAYKETAIGLKGIINSSTIFRNQGDSTSAFQIQQANGTAVFGVDTVNGRIGLGVATPANKLSVNSLTTADTTAQVAIGTSAAGNKGLVLQGVASQTANLFEAQSSTGAVMASIGATGTTLFKNTVDSTSAFQIQDSAGVALLNANTTQGTLSVGTFIPTTVWSAATTTFADYPVAATPRSPTSADFNGDGKLDLAISNSGATNTVSVLLNTGTGTFAAKVDYATGTSPYYMTAADFNGDGKVDLATSNFGSSAISILMNNGNGTFAAKVDYATGAGPQSIAAADFNGDGKADLVVTTGSNAVSVFLNNGNGTFAAYVNYATGGSVVTVTAADFNGDGKPDIAAANSSPTNTVSILINNGNGTFAAKVDYAASVGTNSTGSYMTAADFNGDGKPDLSTLNYASATVSVLLNNGNGTFAAKVDYATSNTPLGMTSGDFNGDGKPDLASTSSSGSSGISILINNGNGTFATKVDYPNFALSGAIISADFNGDGKPDLAAGELPTAIRVILFGGAMTGTAMIQAPSKLVVNASPTVIGQIIQSTAGQTADLLQVRNDVNTTLFSVGATGNVTAAGTLNVAGTFTATGNNTLFKNTANSATAFQIQQASGAAVFGVDTINRRVGIGIATPANILSVNALNTADTLAQVAISTNGSGNKGLIIQGAASQTANLFEAQTSTGAITASVGATGVALFKNTVDSATAFQIQNSSGLALFSADMAAGTINMGSTFQPTYTPAPKVDYVTGSSPRGVTSADFNGDGKVDIATTNYLSSTVSVFLNNGNGTFAAKVDYAAGANPQALSSADFNSDGKADLVVGNGFSNAISVFINNGNGTFATAVSYTTGAGPWSVAVADFNGDGKIDIVSANQTSSTVSIFLNTGTGTFAAKVDYATGTTPTSITAADFNGDGKADLAMAINSGLSVLMNNGTGTFAAKVDYATSFTSYAITSGDFNGDSKPDLAVTSATSSKISVFMNTGTGTFAAKVDYTTASGPQSITAADFNGDGKIDLASANYAANTASVFMNTGTGTFAAKVDYATGINPQSVTSADFNGDGKAEMAIANSGSNTVSVYLEDTAPAPPVAPKVIITTSKSAVGQITKAASGQTADLLQVKDSTDSTMLSVGATGNVLFKNNANSTSAFQIQQASGTVIFGVDTTNGRVGIGTIAPANKLSVNDLTTADAFAQLAIGTGAVGNKGLIVQGILGQTADLLQAQSSTGAVLASISSTGNLTVTSAVITGTLTVNGHIITSGTTPTIAANSAACTTPAVSITGNDTSGTVTIVSGTGCASIGSMATITFNGAFSTTPRIIMTPNNANASNLKWYNGTATTTTFTVDTATIPTDATTYTFNYWVVQ